MIYGLTLPLAVVLGYMLTSDDQQSTVMLVGGVAFALTIPLLIRWYHPILIFSWNSVIIFSFMRGAPDLWMVMAGLGLVFAVFNRILDRQRRESTFCHVPPVTWAIIFFGLVVLTTAQMTGGFGLRSFASSTYGSKGYFTILASIMGYFALTSCPIPLAKARLYLALFLLPGVTAMMSSLIYFSGPGFNFLFAIFPVAEANLLAKIDASNMNITRLGGLSAAGMVIFYYMLARYGIREIFAMTRPLRLSCFVAVFAVALFGGFRSTMVLMLLVFSGQFYFEGLLRTRLLPALLLAGIFSMVILVPFADRLPLAVQRTFSALPFLSVDPAVRSNAESSTTWRLEMWQALLPDLHKYVLLGKGCVLKPTDMYLASYGVRSGQLSSWEASLVAGDYHNGPLSLYITFGSVGVLAFLLFLIASIRVLHQNWQYGDPRLKHINTFLLSMFLARVFFFVFIFGAISNDFYYFIGLIGFSVALNGGCKKAPTRPPSVPVPASA